MDNFEYSIQISDRDWAEFYSTAEECGLTQVSLASDEELLFSDPELDDNTNRSKLIRVSLCPPREEQHAVQSTNTGPSPGDPARHRPKGPRENVLLSGSEDEEEFGSVTRFLCQRETLLQKVAKVDPGLHIPVPSKTKTPLMCPENEGFYSNGCAPSVPSRTREESMLQNETNDPLDCARTGGVGHSPINGNGFPHPEVNVHNEVLGVDVNDCPEIGKSSGSNGFPDDTGHRHLPTVRDEVEVQEEVQHQRRGTTIDELQTDSQHEFRPSDSTRDNTEHTGLEMDSGLQEATRARIHSSAVKQNIPDPLTESFTILVPKSGSLEFKNMSNVDKSVDKFILGFQNVCPTSSPAPGSVTEQALRNQGLSASPRSAPSTNVALTTPEMYDFFFSDDSETANMDTDPEAKHVEDEGIMYTPDMYEYFFPEDEEESKSKGKARPKEQSCKEMVLNSPESPKSDAAADFCLPDAYEFFFADDVGDQSSGGNALSTPAFRAQTAAVASLQSFLPQGLCRVRKGFTVRGSRCKTGRDGQLHQHSTPGEAAGSRALRVPADTGDACLVFLAFASWAVKTSDMQSPDGWKTALLANIGAVSAIQYLRKNTRRTLSDSTTDECEEGP